MDLIGTCSTLKLTFQAGVVMAVAGRPWLRFPPHQFELALFLSNT